MLCIFYLFVSMYPDDDLCIVTKMLVNSTLLSRKVSATSARMTRDIQQCVLH